MRYDSIIIGTGPAGLEAALNLKIRNKNFLLVGPEYLSSKIVKAPKISNYLGLGEVSGLEMQKHFTDHLKEMDIQLTNGRITAVHSMGDYFAVATASEFYETDTVILATGVHTQNPFKGEEDFLGKGVGYCATCDAPLYKGKKVVIVGYSPEAEHEANFVSEIASEVTYIPVASKPTLLNDNVKVVNGRVTEILGSDKAETIVLNTEEIKADGFFILRESIAPNTLVAGLETDGAHIKVNANMETNISGIFAAGDCVGRPYQYIKSAGEGLVAAHSAVQYLTNLDKKA